MILSGTVRAFVSLAFDAAEAVWDVCSAFTSPIAHEIWSEASSPAHGPVGDDCPAAPPIPPGVEAAGPPTSQAGEL